jgi:hypothetical protein
MTKIWLPEPGQHEQRQNYLDPQINEALRPMVRCEVSFALRRTRSRSPRRVQVRLCLILCFLGAAACGDADPRKHFPLAGFGVAEPERHAAQRSTRIGETRMRIRKSTGTGTRFPLEGESASEDEETGNNATWSGAKEPKRRSAPRSSDDGDRVAEGVEDLDLGASIDLRLNVEVRLVPGSSRSPAGPGKTPPPRPRRQDE